jgi:hypothetical protein
MTPAEFQFKAAVAWLISVGVYPSPGRIERTLERRVRHNLNGRECKWREEYLTSKGWVHDTRQRYNLGVSFRPPKGKKLNRTKHGWYVVPG